METLGHVECFPAVSIHFQIFCIEQYYRNVLKCIRGRIVYPKNDFYAFLLLNAHIRVLCPMGPAIKFSENMFST